MTTSAKDVLDRLNQIYNEARMRFDNIDAQLYALAERQRGAAENLQQKPAVKLQRKAAIKTQEKAAVKTQPKRLPRPRIDRP